MILEAATPAERKKLMKVLQLTPTRQKASKYKNKITPVDGIKFHSKREAHRWCDLQTLERAGKISELQRQVRLPLVVVDPFGNHITVGNYVADFRYLDNEAGKFVLEDSKGAVTEVYKLKKKIVEAQYGVEILET